MNSFDLSSECIFKMDILFVVPVSVHSNNHSDVGPWLQEGIKCTYVHVPGWVCLKGTNMYSSAILFLFNVGCFVCQRLHSRVTCRISATTEAWSREAISISGALFFFVLEKSFIIGWLSHWSHWVSVVLWALQISSHLLSLCLLMWMQAHSVPAPSKTRTPYPPSFYSLIKKPVKAVRFNLSTVMQLIWWAAKHASVGHHWDVVEDRTHHTACLNTVWKNVFSCFLINFLIEKIMFMYSKNI